MSSRRSAAGDPRDPGDWLALQCAAALRPVETIALLRAGSSARAALDALRGCRRPDASTLREAQRRLAATGARLLPWGSPGYPERLARLDDAPPVLGVRGDTGALDAPAVAIVGSRAASSEGRRFAHRLAGELAGAGLVVVSGLAFGIDVAAHRGALEAGGRSVGVQACGLDRVYPAAHREVAAALAASGAVTSEFAPGTPPQKAFFPLRNRLISGLARALVVVEARERSGSLVTARHAADQGVEVFAAPGPVGSAGHAGSNRLLRDGARWVLEARDVLDELAWPSLPRARPERPLLTREARDVLDALAAGALAGDALARRLDQSPGRLGAALLELELAGAAVRGRDGLWRAV